MIWTEEGHKAYPELAAAQRALYEARDQKRLLMRKAFPAGKRVLIRLYNGEYTGTVKRTDLNQVFVINPTTGETNGANPLLDTRGKPSVEIID
ncbi:MULTISPECIES: hypothetical protein [Pseudomonas]|uniref:hypothetical protein n=1 Tax=Pseudomonas TaxID=286 RepID=UPI000709E7BF|nr:hypothetical protein [Pseudomonas aeruginosa]KSK30813.1 hypothetical protein APA27_03590 [Pseudomonas aeruginosa]MCD2747756.1 hypothetical protein [Pseudomonas aeruginosa]MCZ7822537.1 hypothetical protein [Pseudomonas aeruginosa]RCM97073.1 hypothetical protein PA17_02026 [Pseudomonas aeruginosa]HBO2687986.1 hypothetical protein [Pseudomonas aeruginosa]